MCYIVYASYVFRIHECLNSWHFWTVSGFTMSPAITRRHIAEVWVDIVSCSGAEAASSSTKKHLRETMYERILASIRNFDWKQTSELSALDLAKRFEVSRTPVRAALERLECEGIVQRRSGKGWILSPITVHDVEEIFEIRELIDPYLARRAAENLSTHSLAELSKIIDEMKSATVSGNHEAKRLADRAFDDILISAVHNERIKRLKENLENQWYRLKVSYVAIEWKEHTYREHQLVVKAIVSRDPDLAAKRMLAHVQGVRTRVVNAWENFLMPFAGEEL